MKDERRREKRAEARSPQASKCNGASEFHLDCVRGGALMINSFTIVTGVLTSWWC